MSPSDARAILGVAPDASDEEIRRAFRRLALQLHPDHNDAPDAVARFMEVYAAYDALLGDEPVREQSKARRGVPCDMCDGEGEILSLWSQSLGGQRLRCPKCMGAGTIKLGARTRTTTTRHTPLNCTCPECNRKWAEWHRRKQPQRPAAQRPQSKPPRPPTPPAARGPSRQRPSLDELARAYQQERSQAPQAKPPTRRRRKTPAERAAQAKAKSVRPTASPARRRYAMRRVGRIVGPVAAVAVVAVACTAVLMTLPTKDDADNNTTRGPAAPTRTPLPLVRATPTRLPAGRVATVEAKVKATIAAARISTPYRPVPRRTPMPTPKLQAAATFPYPGGAPLNRSEIEKWIVHYTNEERKAEGLHPLKLDPSISDIARAHSENMVRLSYGHEIEGKGPTDRAVAAGYNCRAYRADGSYSYGLAENISRYGRVQTWSGKGYAGNYTWQPTKFYGSAQDAARAIVTGWMNSPGHRANIMNAGYQRFGVGVAVDAVKVTKYGWTSEDFFSTQNFSRCS